MQMQSSFNQESKEHAIRIMQNISQHPCAKPFLFPLDPISSNCIDYYEKIKKPICITLIINKLLNAEDNYPKIENWRSDIQLLYKNSITYYGLNSHMGNLAEAFLKIFEKKYRSFLIRYNSSLWLQRFSYLIQKEKMLEMKMPGTMGNVYRSLFTSSTIKPSQIQTSPKMNVFFNDVETVDQTSQSQFQRQNEFNACPISIETQKIENVEDIKPKKKGPGRPRKNLNQDSIIDKEKSEKAPKIRKPRKPRLQKDKVEIPHNQNDDANSSVLSLKLNNFDSSMVDEFSKSFQPFENDTITADDHDQSDRNPTSADISPASFTYGLSSNFTTFQKSQDNSDQQQKIITQGDHMHQSIFASSTFNFASKISPPTPSPIVQNDSFISPPEDCVHNKLPAKLEEKVEDMEDDVLFEVTSCFS